jgi:hypothetical protein
MKLKIFSATLLSILSLIANADTIKVISSKSVPSKMTRNGEVVKATARAHDMNVKVNYPINIVSYHEVYLSNPTNHHVRYTYEFKMCGRWCISKNKDKTLAPGESFTDSENMELEMSFSKTGNYEMIAHTILDSEFSGTHTSSMRANIWVIQ